MATTAEAIRLAFAHHQAGHLREAETLYRRILEVEPSHYEALHLLGLVAYQVGRPEIAVQLIGQAVRLRGDQAAYHSNLGEAFRALGQLDEAERALRQCLKLDPQFADAHNNLGNVLRARNQFDEAAAAFRAAIRCREVFPEPYNNLGTVLQAQGDLTGAIQHYRQALRYRDDYVDALLNLSQALKEQGTLAEAFEHCQRALGLAPANSEAHLTLGILYQERKQIDQAVASYREALRLNPHSVRAHNNLGMAVREQNRADEALACYRRAIQLDPNFADAHFNLGALLAVQGDTDGALDAYREALRCDPNHVKTLGNCGNLMRQFDRLDEALEYFDRALAVDPSYAVAHLNRANVYKLKKMIPEALAGYREAIRLQPGFAEAYNNLAVTYDDLGQPDAAVDCCRQGLALSPESAALWANLSTALQHQGRMDEALDASRRAIALRPEGVSEHSNFLYGLNYRPQFDSASVFAEHLEWARRHAEPLTALAPPHTNDRSPERRLRVGYVSPYFRDHAVNFFTEPLILSHDHEAFEIACYSDVRVGDAITARLRESVDLWRDVRGLGDEKLARLVREDAIDILVDLTGHIAGSRLVAFAHKPAPVQVTYIGYQNTTGMSAMDYRLTDERADPPGLTDAYHTEQLVRLPRSFFCYKPSAAPEVDPLPALSTGVVTFGSFNNFSKVTCQAIETWLTILARVPNSRLLVLAYCGGYLQQHFEQLARERGLDPARIELCAKRPRPEYLQLLQRADIALDPFPFNGHTTTCDSIWMGLPVVMCQGQTYASRFGGSVLANVGLEHLIADSPAEYIEKAVALASDLPALAALRASLRGQMADSVLLDFSGFTRHVERAYRQMWRTWCGRSQTMGS